MKKSKSITVCDLSLEEIRDRILKALRESLPQGMSPKLL